MFISASLGSGQRPLVQWRVTLGGPVDLTLRKIKATVAAPLAFPRLQSARHDGPVSPRQDIQLSGPTLLERGIRRSQLTKPWARAARCRGRTRASSERWSCSCANGLPRPRPETTWDRSRIPIPESPFPSVYVPFRGLSRAPGKTPASAAQICHVPFKISVLTTYPQVAVQLVRFLIESKKLLFCTRDKE